jgi:predicted transcriptional regulator
MVSIKVEVAQLPERLPNDCSLEGIQYHLYVLEKIRHGAEDAEQGRTLSHEQVEHRLSQWRKPA